MKPNIIFSLLLGLLMAWSALIRGEALPLSEIPKRPVTRVSLAGNSALSTEKIQSLVPLSVVAGTYATFANVQSDIDALYALGYFKHVDVALRADSEGMALVYRLQENPVIQNVAFEGNTTHSDTALQTWIHTRPMTVLSSTVIAADITRLEHRLADAGYSLTNVTDVSFNPTGNRVVFTLVETRLDQIILEGNSRFSDRLILREMDQKSGSVFNIDTVREDRNRLLRLGYFSTISPPSLIPAETGDRVNVALSFMERDPHAVRLGLEQGRQTINLTTGLRFTNLLGWGESVAAKAQVGSEQLLGLHYYMPWLFDHRVSLAADRWLMLNPERDSSGTRYDILRNGGNLVLRLPVHAQLNASLTYQSEAIQENVQNPVIAYTKNNLALAVSMDTRNHPAKPTDGITLFAEMSKGGPLGWVDLGGMDFTRMQLTFSQYIRPVEAQALAWRASVGAFSPVTDPAQVLELDRFTIGGPNTVRGYTDPTSQIGLKKIVGNLEYRFYLTNLLSLVLFYDIGSTFDQDLIPSHMMTGQGIGCRFYTPLGAVRLDVAFSKDGTMVAHFALGDMF